MHCSKRGSFQQQIRFLRRQFLQDGDLPLEDVLSETLIEQALIAFGTPWKDRIYSPLVTLWLFLGQVLSADHSCRAAVARLLALRASQGLCPCSAQTGGYCQARKRLPQGVFAEVARQTGRVLDANVDPGWLWKQRRVYMFDGSSVSMPDTPENQEDYPQPDTQKPGLGFPLARFAAVFSLSCGAVLDVGICRYAGKGQGELSLLRRLSGLFSKGDVVLGDRLMCSWVDIAMLKARGVDSVTRLSNRRTDFRCGRRLGKGDHIVQWMKPSRPRLIDYETYALLPDYITVRETRVQIEQAGYRTRSIVVVTTILDTDEVTASDLAEIYRVRWNNELDLRSLKQTMKMEILRCKTPELVRKEIWTHILAYNLIRTIMAQAAVKSCVMPRSISFKGTIQMLEAFQSKIDAVGSNGSAFRQRLCRQLLDAIATHQVGNRPDRVEPRLRKRRPKHYGFLRQPRQETKRKMLKGLTR